MKTYNFTDMKNLNYRIGACEMQETANQNTMSNAMSNTFCPISHNPLMLSGISPNKRGGYLLSLHKFVAILLLLLTVGVGQVWADTSAAANTYTFANQNIGAKYKFYKISDGVYQYRENSYTKDASLGIQIQDKVNNSTGFAIYISSAMKLKVVVKKKSVKSEVPATITVYSITNGSTIWHTFETGINNSTTVSLTLSASEYASKDISFPELSKAATAELTTEEMSLAAGYYYIEGVCASKNAYIYSITLSGASAPTSTYYYRGQDNDWGATPMTVSSGGTYEYYQTTRNNHQFKISTSTSSWDYNYTKVNSGYQGTSITTIGDYSSDNCYIWSAPASYYIIVYKPNTRFNASANPVICASATLPDDCGPDGSSASFTAAGYTYIVGATANEMKLSGVTATCGGTLSYKWYHSTSADFNNDAKVEITGATGNTYTPSTATAHATWYYFCEVSESGSTNKYVSSASGAIVVNNPPTHTVTVNSNNVSWGTAAAANTTVAEGGTTTITATAKTGYKFTGWSVTGTGSSLSSTTDNPTTLTMGTANVTVTATFAENSCPSSGTIFSADVIVASNQSFAASSTTEVTASQATVTGGTVSAKNEQTSAKDLIAKQNNVGWFTLTNNNTYFIIELDCELQVGDVISAKIYNTNNAERGLWLSTNSSRPGSAPASKLTNTSTSTVEYTITSTDGLAGKTTFNIFRATGNSTYFDELNITRPLTETCSAPTSVNISGGYHFFPGETISLTSSVTGAAADATYKWEKYNYSTSAWETVGTAANYSKANATVDDAGAYRLTVSNGSGCETTSDEYEVKCLQIYIKDNSNNDIVNAPLVKKDATHATYSYNLAGQTTYRFILTDGCGHWFGNTGTMNSTNHSNWSMNAENTDCRMTTSIKTATYTFSVDFSANLGTGMKVSIDYPASNQAAGKVIYFDNVDVKWSKLFYRIGRTADSGSKHAQATELTKVPGTDNLYKVTTAAYNNFDYWHIANNSGWTSNNEIDRTKTNDQYAITNAIAFEGGDVSQDVITITPNSSHATGVIDINNNCEFYTYATAVGMKTQNVSITAPTNGTITVAYKDIDNSNKSFTSGDRDLAHTVILTITATPDAGYSLGSLTVNGAAHTSGSTYVVTSTTVIAATFECVPPSVTTQPENKTVDKGQATLLACAGEEGVDYQWYNATDNTAAGTGAKDAAVTVGLGYNAGGWTTPAINASGTFQYYCKLTKNGCETNTNTVSITVNVTCPTAGTVYKFQTKSSGLGTGNVCAAKNTDYPMNDKLQILEGGSLTARASSDNTSNLKYNNNCFQLTGGSNGWLIVNLDCPIQEGDKIRFINSNSGSVKVRHTSTSTSTNEIELKGNSSTTKQIVDIPSQFAGKTTLYIVRGSNSSDISYFEIVRPYVITLDATTNGGTVASSTAYAMPDEPTALPRASKSGSSFVGWFTAASGGTQVSNPYIATANTTLYAQFEDCPSSGTLYKFEVGSLTSGNFTETGSFDISTSNYLTTLVGGTLIGYEGNNNNYITKTTSQIQISNNGGYLKVDLDCPIQAGDVFKTTISGNTVAVTSGSSRSTTNTIATGTLKENAIPAALVGAQTIYLWRGGGNTQISYFEITRPSGYHVTYNANGATSGTVPTDATLYASGASVTVLGNTGSLKKGDQIFSGWNTAADGSGTSYAAGAVFAISNNTTLYAQYTEEMSSDCEWAYWVVSTTDAANNGVTNNSTVFSGAPSDGSGATATCYVGEKKFDLTRRSSNTTPNITFKVPAGKTANLYIEVIGSGSREVQIKQGSVVKYSSVPSGTQLQTYSGIPAGTYTITSTGNLGWLLFAAELCDDCADTKPTIDGNTSGCPSVTLTAANYTADAILQWYKKNGDTFDAIEGETGVTYTATETGVYQVAAQKNCRLLSEPKSVTITSAVAAAQVNTSTTAYEQGDEADLLTAIAEGATNFIWEKNEGSGWTVIAGAVAQTYQPSTAAVGTIQYRVKAQNACNGEVWITSDAVSITVTKSNKVTITWTVDNGTPAVSAGAATVNSGGWYVVKATFTSGITATPSLTMLTEGVELDEITLVSANVITGKVLVPAAGVDAIQIKAAVAAGGSYGAAESTLTLNVTKCQSGGQFIEVKSDKTKTDAPFSYTFHNDAGWLIVESGASSPSTSSNTYNVDGHNFTICTAAKNSFRIVSKVDGVTAIRLYVKNESSSNITITNVYQSAAPFTDLPESNLVTPSITYSDAENMAFTKKTNSYADIALTSTLMTDGCLAFTTSANIRIYGVRLYVASASGDKPTLAWDQAGLTQVETVTGSGNFTHTASVTTANFKSIASIQYTSSDLSVATVDGNTGEVHITATDVPAGETVEATITATLPATGCFKGSSPITYKVIVAGCTDKAGVLTADRTTYCATAAKPVLTLSGYDEGAEILGWYKDGVEIAGQAGKTTYTAPSAGTYYAVTKLNCESGIRSNTMVIAPAEAPDVDVLHSDWHIRCGRQIGVPLKLFKITGEYSDYTVSHSPTLTGVKGEIVDGIFQVTGTPTKGLFSEPTTITVTLTARNDCGAEETAKTTIIVDPYKEALQIAYIVEGTVGGGWNKYETSQSTESPLFQYLSSQSEFDVTAVNGYNTIIAEELLTYYSQYDVVMLTDHLNSKKNPSSGSISYSDAMGVLVDNKPMLSTEAYVSGKTNWSKVGLTTEPADGTTTNNECLKMTLLCPAAEIFTGTSYHVGDVIQVADALPGTAKENKMLQGFPLEAAKDFVYMATVQGANGELIALCERQHVLEARLMVFGLNWNGSTVLNENGKLVVKQILLYLMKWDADQVSDCAIYFDDKTGDHKWSTAGNWGPARNILPRYYHNVRIEQPVDVDVANAAAGNIKIAITSEGNIKGQDNTAVLNGKINILPTGALTVNGGIYMVDSKGKKDFVTKQQVPTGLLHIEADKDNSGALAFGEEKDDMLPRATMVTYSKANFTMPTTVEEYKSFSPIWQYIGTPYSDGVAIVQYYNAWLCKFNANAEREADLWPYVDDYDHLEPFAGYAITQNVPTAYAMPGTLIKPTSKTIDLEYNSLYDGQNIVANSFSSPIYVNNLEASDFDNAEAAVYVFNAGTYKDWDVHKAAAGAAAGQYTSIPVNAGAFTDPGITIAPMQGFMVKALSGGGSLSIDYEKVVLSLSDIQGGSPRATEPLRAPRRNAPQNDDIRLTTITINGEQGADKVHILTGSDEFTDGFDNGWDGRKIEGEKFNPMLSVNTVDGNYAVSSQPQLENTTLNFHAGNDEFYEMMIATRESGLVLYDLLTHIELPLVDTTYYAFTSYDRTAHQRFVIRRKADVATDIEVQGSGYVSAYKLGADIVIDNTTSSEATVSLFDATGKLIYSSSVAAKTNVNVPVVATSGVYILRATTNAGVQTVKITF